MSFMFASEKSNSFADTAPNGFFASPEDSSITLTSTRKSDE